MNLDVRTCAPDEVAGAIGAIFHFFGHAPTEETIERFTRVLPPERMHGAFEDGRAVGGAGAFPFELTVPGGRVRAAGVTVVGVLPTHRRRGILRQMMRTQLDDVRARGEPVAYLWASEASIYGRFGYGLASLTGNGEIPRAHAAFARPLDPTGRVRLVSVEEAVEALPALYEAVARETPGMFARTRVWWETRVVADPEWRRDGGGEMARALLEVDGDPAAYALYRLHPKFERFVSVGRTEVIEAMGVTPQATAEIWRYLLDVDWMDRVSVARLPTDHPLLLLLAEPRRLQLTVVDALWVRLVDVEAALSGRAYRDAEPVVLQVEDEFCPWNAGRWRVATDGAARTDAEPDLAVGVDALGSVYLGGFTFSQLARAALLGELRPGGLARADALFATDRAPWCPEIF